MRQDDGDTELLGGQFCSFHAGEIRKVSVYHIIILLEISYYLDTTFSDNFSKFLSRVRRVYVVLVIMTHMLHFCSVLIINNLT